MGHQGLPERRPRGRPRPRHGAPRWAGRPGVRGSRHRRGSGVGGRPWWPRLSVRPTSDPRHWRNGYESAFLIGTGRARIQLRLCPPRKGGEHERDQGSGVHCHRHDLRRLRERSKTSLGEACRREGCDGGSGQEGSARDHRRRGRLAGSDHRGDPGGGQVSGEAVGLTTRHRSAEQTHPWGDARPRAHLIRQSTRVARRSWARAPTA